MSGVSFGDGIRDKIIMAESDFFLFPIMQAGYTGRHCFFTGKNHCHIGVKILYGRFLLALISVILKSTAKI